MIPPWQNVGIRARLWLALAFLTVATLLVGGIAWYALDRAASRLQSLHSRTLQEVAHSLLLSRQSSELATSAPYLLTLKSAYLIRAEGQKMRKQLQPLQQNKPPRAKSKPNEVYAFQPEIAQAAQQMNTAVTDLVNAATATYVERDRTRILKNRLVQIENTFYRFLASEKTQRRTLPMWLSLQSETNELIGASNADSLVNLGERRRRFQRLQREFAFLHASDVPQQWAQKLADLARGENGLFLVRRRQRFHQIKSQNALFRIRHYAGRISDLSGQFAQNAEAYLSRQRQNTTTAIGFAKALILAIVLASVSIASIAALYVSGYVARNIQTISDAMQRLAAGDSNTRLSLKVRANDEVGKLHAAFGIFRTNALRLDRQNRLLHQQNALFEKIFKYITAGVAITDAQGRITQQNQSFFAFFQARPPQKEGAEDPPYIEAILAQSVYATQAKSAGLTSGFLGATEITGTDGHVLEARASRLPDGGAVWLFYDTTERREMENRLAKIRHIEGLSKLTGEVAHDFGNILAAINSNIYLLQTGSKSTRPEVLLQRISNAVELGSSLTQRLLAFARQQALIPEVVELNTLVVGLADLVQIGLKDGVTLALGLADTPLYVSVDPGQLESALLNLCLNANQAIAGTGTITLSLQKTKDTAIISVKDTGCGMDEDTLSHALEPFFTARTDGEGTGLGLSMVYGFIKQTGGDIDIKSALGEGTTLTLTLALCIQTPPAPAPSRTALLVEDDPDMRESVAAQLRSIGYKVERVASFEAAMATLASGPPPDALVTDLHLNDGQLAWEIVERCLQTCPDTRILITSGRLPRQHRFTKAPNPRVKLTAKPLSPEILRNALQ